MFSGFDLAHLFTSGSGFCYPLSPGTLWQDAAGTLPVTADGQVVGRAVDASGDGNHATQPGTASIRPVYKTAPTRLSFDGSDDRLVSTLNPTTSGTIACRFQTSTASRVMIGSQGATDGRCYLGIGSDGRLAAGIGAAGMTTIVHDQTARRNLLSYTEDFSNAAWGKDGSTLVTGDLLTFLGAPRASYLRQDNIAGPRTFSADLKRGTFRYGVLVCTSYASGNAAIFDLDTGAVSKPPTAVGSLATITALEDGWYRCTLTAGASATSGTNAISGSSQTSSLSDSDNGSIRARFPQLELGIEATEYQPILGATYGDIRGTGWRSGAVTWNGSTVKLYLDGAEVYSGAQSGAVNTTIPMAIGALNASGTQNSFFGGDILANPIALDYAATPAQIAQMHQAWSNQT